MSLKFQKRVENFTCGYCGIEVKGNGFTNHCPQCLWSKHVDIHPGDRGSTCNALMKPIRVDLERQEYIITHECVKCGHSKRNKMSLEDDFDVITQIAQNRGYAGE